MPSRALILGIILALASPAVAADKAVAVGGRVPKTGSLRDMRGSGRPLDGLTGPKATALVFLGTECPVSALYLPTLVSLEKAYRAKGVQFLAVYPNDGDDLDRVAAHAADHDLPFPVFKDAGQKLADAVGAARVPAVAVLDADRNLRYRGRVDDRYGPGHRRPKATRDDLAQALDAVLAGKPVAVPETEADGCLVERAGKSRGPAGVTYTKDVARILQAKCQTCHRPGAAGPFPLLTYEDAARHARMIREVTAERRMPPWHADPRHGKFANDRRLAPEEVATLAAWVEAGTPRGDAKDLPEPVKWADGWSHGKPDVVFTMPEAFHVPADGTLPYQNFFVDTNFTEDKWVRAAEARPGVPGVVHHVVAYMVKEGQKRPFTSDGNISALVGWAPGDLGLVCPPDTALRVPKGTRLMLELHYTPNGTAAADRSSVGVWFADKPPKNELLLNPFVNEAISLPPNDPHYRAEANWRVPADARVLSLSPHMHYRGKDFKYELVRPDGTTETVLSVPRYDFGWQSVYRFADPLKLPAGSRLHAVAHWDNSRNNPYNPDPAKRVEFGLQTWEEMMVGWVAYVWERPEAAAELAKRPPDPAGQMFERLDRNGDGVITADEIPPQMKPLMVLAGPNLPEKMDRPAFEKVFAEMRKKFGKKPAAKPADPKDPPAKP